MLVMAGLDDLTEAEMVSLVRKKLVRHALANPTMPFEQVIDDVVAYLAVRFGLQRTQGHAAMAVFLHNHASEVAQELATKGRTV